MSKNQIRIVWLVIYLALGAFIGSIESAVNRHGGKDGCEYKTLAPMFNPAYIAACEIFRVRFKQ